MAEAFFEEAITVTLKLSKEEAEVLYDILGCGVAGVGRRRHADTIYNTLRKIGKLNHPEYHKYDFKGTMVFSEPGA